MWWQAFVKIYGFRRARHLVLCTASTGIEVSKYFVSNQVPVRGVRDPLIEGMTPAVPQALAVK
jgi:hypothetical protein